MNKLITVNIGSIRFDIEEDAYLELQKYLAEVDRIFSKKYPEVVEDIETRIAEKLYPKQSKNHVIKIIDITKLIKALGNPSDLNSFDAAPSDEPAATSHTSKKLFASSEDVVVSGVCAGIAEYFGIEAVWVRLLFVLAFFSGFLSPVAIIGYIFLLIVLPKATSVTDKILMKGEEINLSNIQANLKNTVNSGKTLLKKNSGKIEKTLDKFFDFIANISSSFEKILKKFLPFISRFFGFCLMFFSIVSAIGFVALAGLLFTANGIYDFPIEYFMYFQPILLPLILIVGVILFVPLVFLYKIGYSFFIRKNTLTLVSFLVFAGVWIAGLCALAFLAFPYFLLFTY